MKKLIIVIASFIAVVIIAVQYENYKMANSCKKTKSINYDIIVEDNANVHTVNEVLADTANYSKEETALAQNSWQILKNSIDTCPVYKVNIVGFF